MHMLSFANAHFANTRILIHTFHTTLKHFHSSIASKTSIHAEMETPPYDPNDVVKSELSPTKWLAKQQIQCMNAIPNGVEVVRFTKCVPRKVDLRSGAR